MNKLAQVIILTAVFATVVESSVLRRSTIENPCRTIITSPDNGSFLSLACQINSTIQAARTVKQMCETVETTLLRENYLTPTEIDRIPNNITGLSAEYTNTNMNHANKIAQLQEDYTIISKHKLYIEHAALLARLVGRNLSQALQNVSHSLQILLTNLDTALRFLGSPSTDRKVPSMEQVTIEKDTKVYNKYIYVLSKTTKNVIASLQTKYENFRNIITGSN